MILLKAESVYHVSRNGENYGPYTTDQIIEQARNGQLLSTDKLWTEGAESWVEVSQFSQLSPYFPREYQQPPIPSNLDAKKRSKKHWFWIAPLIVLAIGFGGLIVWGGILQWEVDSAIFAAIEKKEIPLSERHPRFQEFIGSWKCSIYMGADKVTGYINYREDGTYSGTAVLHQSMGGTLIFKDKGRWDILHNGKTRLTGSQSGTKMGRFINSFVKRCKKISKTEFPSAKILCLSPIERILKL